MTSHLAHLALIALFLPSAAAQWGAPAKAPEPLVVKMKWCYNSTGATNCQGGVCASWDAASDVCYPGQGTAPAGKVIMDASVSQTARATMTYFNTSGDCTGTAYPPVDLIVDGQCHTASTGDSSVAQATNSGEMAVALAVATVGIVATSALLMTEC